MLSPDYLEHVPDRLVELYAQAETDIIADMARKINAYDYFSSASEWQAVKVHEMGLTYEEIQKKLSALSGRTLSELKKLLEEAGVKTLSTDDAIYRKAGLLPQPLKESKHLIAILNESLKKTNNTFKNLTSTTAKEASGQFVEALDRAYMQIVTGGIDKNAAVRSAIQHLTENGLRSIKYPTRTDHLDVAVRRAVRTGVNQTAGRLQEARAEEMGCDLVETTAHDGARPSHETWQGKVFSRSGSSKKYPPFKESTGYGTVTGLMGANCRHSFYPFFEDSEPIYTKSELAELNQPKYHYRGKDITEYEAVQRQRYHERQIRRWKREKEAMKAAGQPTDRAEARLRKWNRIQDDFLEQTGLKRQVDLEQIAKKVEKPAAENVKNPKMTTEISDDEYQNQIKARRAAYKAKRQKDEITEDDREKYESLKQSEADYKRKIEDAEVLRKSEELKVLSSSVLAEQEKAAQLSKNYAAQIKQLQKELDSVLDEKRAIQGKRAVEAEKALSASGVAKKIKLSNKMSLESIDTVQNTLEELIVKRGMPALEAVEYNEGRALLIGGKGAVASYEWNSKTMYLGKAISDEAGFKRRRIQNEEAFLQRKEKLDAIYRQQLKDLEKDLKTAETNEKKGYYKQLIKETQIKLDTARYRVPEDVKDVIIHEYGHHVHNMAGGINDIYGKKELNARKINGKWFWGNRLDVKADAAKISEYAASNPLEAFAESFTAYMKGQDVPDSLKDIVEGAIKKSGTENILEKSAVDGIISAKDNELSKYIGKEIIETDNKSIRKWYYANVHDIPNQIDRSQPLAKQAEQAYNLRIKYKRQARDAMSDKETLECLEEKRPVKTFQELKKDKMKRKGMTEEEALEDIIKTASKTNEKVDENFDLKE